VGDDTLGVGNIREMSETKNGLIRRRRALGEEQKDDAETEENPA
jgi:hypothetical protein